MSNTSRRHLLLGVCLVVVGHLAAASDAAVESVIVTARKLTEDAQDVPASLQVLTGDQLDAADVTRLHELQFEIPGLTVTNLGLFGAGFSLRGVTDEGGSSLAVASHLNGAYLGTANLVLARLFDLQRIEVLKGPQGTLYGRNATGGAINFLTRPPGDQPGAAFEAARGSFDTTRLEGSVDIPVRDRVGVRLAFIGSQGDGYIDNAIDGREFAEADFWGLRASLAFTPTDELRVDIMAERVEDDGAAGELWSPNVNFLPDPDDIRLTRVTQPDPDLTVTNDIVTVNVAYQTGIGTLYSVTAFADNHVRNLDDCAGLPVLEGCSRGVRPSTYRQWSQELRLSGGEGGRLDWLLGAYAFDGRQESEFFLSAPRLNPNPINDYSATADERAYAAFGQLRYAATQRLRLTTGARFSFEENAVADVGSGAQDNDEPIHVADSWDHPSWRVGIEFAATDTQLVYASISTGFKSGGITTERLPTGEFDGFDPERLTAWELGIKSEASSARWTLNAAAFYYDFDDLQVSTVAIIEDTVVSVIDNAARAEIYGLDVSADVRLTDSLGLSAGLVWMPRRKYVDFETAIVSDDFSGNDIRRAPEWSSTTAISWSKLFPALGELALRLGYSYRSDFFFTKENTADSRQKGFGLWHLQGVFESASGWYLFASGHNLTNEDYFNQMFIQSSPGYPRTWEAGVGIRI